MAELQDFIKSLEKELTCSICEGIFNEPKILQCLHSFCGKCIEKWNETCKNRLTCPTCRSREDQGDVSKLRSSFYLDSLKQLLLAMRNKAQSEQGDKPDCSCCEKRAQLVAFCPQCEGFICSDCSSAHNTMKHLRNQHQLTKFSDFKQEHVNNYVANQWHCQEKFHEKNKLEYYCKTCNKYICQKCTAITHTVHDKISIEEKVEDAKHLINDHLDQVNQYKQRFVQQLELSKENIFRLENEIETAKKEVSDYVRAQMKILQDHENAMMTTLDEMFLEQKTANDEEQREINTVIQEFDAVNDQGKRLQDQQIYYIILQSQLPHMCQELLQRPPVLSSKLNKRNIIIRFIPNLQLTQSLQVDLGKIEESFADPSRCSMQLLNDIVRCGFVNKFEILTRNSEDQICKTNKGFIDVQIKDGDGCEIEKELIESEFETGKFVVTYKAVKPSTYQILVSVGGKRIDKSPIKVKAIDAKSDFMPFKIFEEELDETETLFILDH